ncbi:MAG: alpha/beta hydrolase [Patescibacteria group bacterium]|nr:alpha/beta hydrolase [Patescibacteria group bacterium]
MKKALIIHGSDGSPIDHWYENEKKELEKLGYSVLIPQMPNPSNPKQDEWVSAINDITLTEHSLLMGFSLGGTAILKFLEQSAQRMNTVILIATPIDDIGADQLNNFFGKFNFQKIKGKADKFVVINQDKDPMIPVEQGYKLAKELGVALNLVAGNNHFLSPNIDLAIINKNI